MSRQCGFPPPGRQHCTGRFAHATLSVGLICIRHGGSSVPREMPAAAAGMFMLRREEGEADDRGERKYGGLLACLLALTVQGETRGGWVGRERERERERREGERREGER
jgi:hypothetical protein